MGWNYATSAWNDGGGRTHHIEEALVARRRVRSTGQWRQPLLPGMAEQVTHVDGHGLTATETAVLVGGATGGDWVDWEEASFREACRYAARLAAVALDGLEGQLHQQRPGGYVVEGWRERTLVTRCGDVRVSRANENVAESAGDLSHLHP